RPWSTLVEAQRLGVGDVGSGRACAQVSQTKLEPGSELPVRSFRTDRQLLPHILPTALGVNARPPLPDPVWLPGRLPNPSLAVRADGFRGRASRIRRGGRRYRQ